MWRTNEQRERGEYPERLEAKMAPAESVLRDVLAFLSDAHNLAIEGIA
jgi:hypothetical protein